MKAIVLSLLLVTVLGTASVSRAGDGEIIGGISNTVPGFGSGTGSGSSANIVSGSFSFGLNGGYSWGLSHEVQFSAKVGVYTQSSLTILQPLVGITLNFGGTQQAYNDAFFLRPMLGITYFNFAGFSSTEFTFEAMFGKRFKITDAVSYTPQAGVWKMNSTDTVVTIVPFSFSVFL